MTGEMWKDVPGFEGHYQVSDRGRVRSVDRYVTQRDRWGGKTKRLLRGKLMKPCRYPNGYLAAQVSVGDERVSFLIHRLVLTCFDRDPADGEQGNHKNGDRADNRIENLEWLSCSDNHRHSYRNLGRKPHARTRPVIVGNLRFDSRAEAARFLGVSTGSVCSAINRGHRCAGRTVTNV